MSYICSHPDVKCPVGELHFFDQKSKFKKGEKYYRYLLHVLLPYDCIFSHDTNASPSNLWLAINLKLFSLGIKSRPCFFFNAVFFRFFLRPNIALKIISQRRLRPLLSIKMY